MTVSFMDPSNCCKIVYTKDGNEYELKPGSSATITLQDVDYEAWVSVDDESPIAIQVWNWTTGEGSDWLQTISPCSQCSFEITGTFHLYKDGEYEFILYEMDIWGEWVQADTSGRMSVTIEQVCPYNRWEDVYANTCQFLAGYPVDSQIESFIDGLETAYNACEGDNQIQIAINACITVFNNILAGTITIEEAIETLNCSDYVEMPYFKVNLNAPSRVVVHENVIIEVDVLNTGGAEGTQFLELTADGGTGSQKVTLNPGESRNLTFEWRPEEARTHTIEACSQNECDSAERVVEPSNKGIIKDIQFFSGDSEVSRAVVGQEIQVKVVVENPAKDKACLKAVGERTDTGDTVIDYMAPVDGNAEKTFIGKPHEYFKMPSNDVTVGVDLFRAPYSWGSCGEYEKVYSEVETIPLEFTPSECPEIGDDSSYIKAQIIDTTGSPVAGLRVECWKKTFPGWWYPYGYLGQEPGWEKVAESSTDSEGITCFSEADITSDYCLVFWQNGELLNQSVFDKGEQFNVTITIRVEGDWWDYLIDMVPWWGWAAGGVLGAALVYKTFLAPSPMGELTELMKLRIMQEMSKE